MTDSSLATTSISLLTRGKEGKPSSYAAVLKNVPSSVSISTRKKLDIFSCDVHPAPLCSKKKHENKPDSLKKKPDSLVQIEPKAAAATAVPKRKKSAVQSYALNRSACKILGDQPNKKRKKMIMEVLGMDVLSVNFSQASMDDANVLSFPSATSSFMKEVVKTAKVLIKKQDIRIKELEIKELGKLDDNESIAEMESNNNDVLQQAKNKEKLRKRREESAMVRWKGRNIFLGSNLHKKQIIEKKKSAMVWINEWKSMQPIPTREWVILELERLGIRKLLNDNTASLSDELKARKEVAEVSILNCLLFLFVHLFLTHPHYLFRPKKHIRL